MYAPLGQPQTTINWSFCFIEGLTRTLFLLVTCAAFFWSFSSWPTIKACTPPTNLLISSGYVVERKTEGYELATCTVVEALVKEELCVVKSSIHTCYSAQWKVQSPIPPAIG